LVIRQIDTHITRHSGMDSFDLAVHLLGDASVRKMPLFGRTELDEMKKLAQIPSEQDADAVCQRQHILRFQGVFLGEAVLSIGRPPHTGVKGVAQPTGHDVIRHAVPIARRELLPRLCGHAMPLDVPKNPVIEHDIEGIVQVLYA
jgi:hypothetical protein